LLDARNIGQKADRHSIVDFTVSRDDQDRAEALAHLNDAHIGDMKELRVCEMFSGIQVERLVVLENHSLLEAIF
jgi:hypothetical protein